MKVIAKNKRARYDYDIRQVIEAGIVLSGAEVKSVKAGHISLKGSFISIHNGEAYLVNTHINPYKFASQPGYDPLASRKLLLHRTQIEDITSQIQSQGMTVVPLSVGLNHGLVKLEIGVGRGKKRYDKRETIKKRDMIREANLDAKPNK